ncbi:MAG: 2OG-Fe(II) oxygenase [Candidatus Binatus sp.]|uniref:2OG-Fe(II) oxygenase n=1 Tax=Candidatus Binatus sp. TaxID=2811406 RepID=UPI0027286E80|nr:2OG-Fe(II) oxygenase [Candidatus Binatus sp.]MDO8434697.1 2OG-Fe(II) oxygenase [Candidatus Binatus sp.]
MNNRASPRASIGDRIAALDWKRIEGDLDTRGSATTGKLLSAAECGDLIALYDDRERFRSRVVMERFRYGVGEYKYFVRPMPPIVEQARVALYRRLHATANRWARALGDDADYPASLARYLEICRAHGQTRPTPLILRYEAGGYNCLHQDLYGEISFPLQFTCVLSRPGIDFEGGELLLVEQRPRAQSRGDAIALDLGEGIIFANRFRPVAGARGYYRATMRHGVSTITSGLRYAMGIIFHDAA